MRIALLSVAALAAGLAVPVSIAAAANPATPAGSTVATTTYRDPAQAAAPTVAVTGTLTPIDTETRGHEYVVSLPGGTLVPVSLARADEIDRPAAFAGDIAIPDSVARRAEARGADIDPGEDVSASSDDGRRVLAAASTATAPLPVESATLRTPDQRTARASAASAGSAQRLYLAVITNRGTNESASSIASKTAAMRSYWTTNADGLITSFTQPDATVHYSSAQASSSNNCGLSSNTTNVWNEAAAKFPGVDFSADGNHLMVIAPSACANGAVGIGTIGASIHSGGRTIATLGDTGVAVGVHELGHNFSLEHANAERCSSSCSTQEYWDLYSIMALAVSGGSWTPPALDSTYRVQTGIASASEVPTITRTSTVELSSRGATSGTRGLLVTDPSSKARYAVEYRAGTGRDATAFYASTRPRELNGYVYERGVTVTRIEDDFDSTTVMTHASGGDYVTSFDAGESFARGKVTIAVRSMSDDTATVTVTLPAAATPTPTTSPTPSSGPTTVAPTAIPTELPTDDPTDPTDAPSSTPPAAPKSFTAANPVIVGRAQVGRVLRVRTGEWSPRPERLSAQWFAGGQPIRRATGGAIVVPRSAYGLPVTVRLVGSRAGYETTARTSAPTAAVTAGRFTSKRVKITGHAKIGRTLVARTGSWSPQPSFSYRWYANGKRIAKATGRTLKVTRALRGKRISVRITARQAGYRAATQASRRTSSVR